MTSAAGGFPRIENQSPASHHPNIVITENKIAVPSNKFRHKFGWNGSKRKLSLLTIQETTILHTVLSTIPGKKILVFPRPKCDSITSWLLSGPLRSHYIFHELLHVNFYHVWLQPYPQVSKYVDAKPAEISDSSPC